jgi:hypothetical protein
MSAADQVASIALTRVTPRTTPLDLSASPLASIALTQVTTGLRGPAGADATGGGTGATFFTHNQPTPLDVWVVNHNLGYRPSVNALSVGGVAMLAEVVHASANQALVYFDSPTSGLAVCS